MVTQLKDILYFEIVKKMIKNNICVLENPTVNVD